MRDPYETYYKLTKLSQRIGFPESFRKDLTVHDYNRIMSEDPAVFIEVLRSTGTHYFNKDDFDNNEFILDLRALLETYPEARIFLYSFGEFQEITELIPRIDRIRSSEIIEVTA